MLTPKSSLHGISKEGLEHLEPLAFFKACLREAVFEIHVVGQANGCSVADLGKCTMQWRTGEVLQSASKDSMGRWEGEGGLWSLLAHVLGMCHCRQPGLCEVMQDLV